MKIMMLLLSTALSLPMAGATQAEAYPQTPMYVVTDFVGPVGNAIQALENLRLNAVLQREDGKRPLDQFSTTTLLNGTSTLSFTHKGYFLQSELGASEIVEGELKEDLVFETSIVLGNSFETTPGYIILSTLALPPAENLLASAIKSQLSLVALNFQVTIPKGSRFRSLNLDDYKSRIPFVYSLSFDTKPGSPIVVKAIPSGKGWTIPQIQLKK